MGLETFITSIVVPLIASGIGGFIAIYSSDRSVSQTLTAQEQRDKDRQEEIIQGVVQAIYAELNICYNVLNSQAVVATWEKFKEKEELDKIREKDKDTEYISYYVSHFPVPEDYLVIYRSNANVIGQIDKSLALPRQIVSNYMLLQAIMGHFSINNTFLIQHRKTGDQEVLYELQGLGVALKKECDRFNKSAEKLFEVLRQKYKVQNSASI